MLEEKYLSNLRTPYKVIEFLKQYAHREQKQNYGRN